MGEELKDQTLVLCSVEGSETGEVDMEFDNGEQHGEPVIVVHAIMVDADTTEKRLVNLIVPKSVGASLLVELLTEDQWDAVVNA